MDGAGRESEPPGGAVGQVVALSISVARRARRCAVAARRGALPIAASRVARSGGEARFVGMALGRGAVASAALLVAAAGSLLPLEMERLRATVGGYAVMNCHLDFPFGNEIPYHLQWDKDVSLDTITYPSTQRFILLVTCHL